jgi:outer membrane murein-binding lipoprotein Lpp
MASKNLKVRITQPGAMMAIEGVERELKIGEEITVQVNENDEIPGFLVNKAEIVGDTSKKHLENGQLVKGPAPDAGLVDKLEAETKSLREEIAALRSELATAKTENARLNDDVLRATGEVQQVNPIIQDLNAQIATLTEENKKLKSASKAK